MNVFAQLHQSVADRAHACFALITLTAIVCTPCLYGKQGQPLCHVVVQLPCEARAFVFLRGDQPLAEIPRCIFGPLSCLSLGFKSPPIEQERHDENRLKQDECRARENVSSVLLENRRYAEMYCGTWRKVCPLNFPAIELSPIELWSGEPV